MVGGVGSVARRTICRRAVRGRMVCAVAIGATRRASIHIGMLGAAAVARFCAAAIRIGVLGSFTGAPLRAATPGVGMFRSTPGRMFRAAAPCIGVLRTLAAFIRGASPKPVRARPGASLCGYACRQQCDDRYTDISTCHDGLLYWGVFRAGLRNCIGLAALALSDVNVSGATAVSIFQFRFYQ